MYMAMKIFTGTAPTQKPITVKTNINKIKNAIKSGKTKS